MTTRKACMECGMHVAPGEYHPYAACLMFRGCFSADTVRANLAAVRNSRVEVTTETCEFCGCANAQQFGGLEEHHARCPNLPL